MFWTSITVVLRSTLVVCLVLGASRQVRAQSEETQDFLQVEQLSGQAMERYRAGDFDGAIELYQQALKVYPAAALLYNMAAIFERHLQEPRAALKHYQRYLAAPDAEPPLVKKARVRIDALKEQLARERAQKKNRETKKIKRPEVDAPPPAPEEPVQPQVPPPLVSKEAVHTSVVRSAGWGVGVVGVLALWEELDLSTRLGKKIKRRAKAAATPNAGQWKATMPPIGLWFGHGVQMLRWV